jgi:lipopolysaccharide heptosyltransferase I
MTPSTHPRILIIKLSSLGDLFHALPTVRAIKAGLNAEIDWVTQPEYAELAHCFGDVNNVIPFPRRSIGKGLPAFLRNLRKTRYDYVIDLQGLLKSALVSAASRGGRKIGPSGAREGANLFYHQVAGKKNKRRHAVDELLDVVRNLNLPVPEPVEFPIVFPKHSGVGPGLHIAICPFSRAAGKNWPADRFVQVAKQLQREAGAVIHLVGGPADRLQCDEMAAAIGAGTINHAGKTTLIELGSLLQEMDLLITVDSGPMHMAAAIGTPTLALFGPTSPLRTGPYGGQHCVVESSFQTSEKRISKKIRQSDLRYMDAIPVGPVFEAALSMIRWMENP